ncbi:MAG TPA: cytochrome b5 domain-containing protein [Smithellaceae bacterium]|nr:cytochrome b5 domain-containing protein [Smithellaceae bacterium]
MKEFDQESLAQFDGKNGRPCYIAYGNRVIDVSASKLWKTGTHMKRHPAGTDLTAAIGAAPHTTDVLEKYPQVGILKKKVEEPFLPAPLQALMERVPFLRRHPHPMVVHFPMVFSLAPFFFYLLYLLTEEQSFEATALHCLAADILFIVPSIATGFLTWRVNYQAKPMKPVRIKIYASFVLLIAAVTAFLWRILRPEASAAAGPEAMIYFVLLILMAVLASVVGYFGGGLTFPVEKQEPV